MIRPPAGKWSIAAACNDYRNGAFKGSADHFHFVTPNGQPAADFYMGGPVKFAVEGRSIRLGRRHVFPILASREWMGNWCWNEYWLDDDQAARFLRILWKNGQCEGGWCDLLDRLKDGERATAELLREVQGNWEASRP